MAASTQTTPKHWKLIVDSYLEAFDEEPSQVEMDDWLRSEVLSLFSRTKGMNDEVLIHDTLILAHRAYLKTREHGEIPEEVRQRIRRMIGGAFRKTLKNPEKDDVAGWMDRVSTQGVIFTEICEELQSQQARETTPVLASAPATREAQSSDGEERLCPFCLTVYRTESLHRHKEKKVSLIAATHCGLAYFDDLKKNTSHQRRDIIIALELRGKKYSVSTVRDWRDISLDGRTRIEADPREHTLAMSLLRHWPKQSPSRPLNSARKPARKLPGKA